MSYPRTAGISSSAYYSGLFLADIIIYVVPCILILIVSIILKIETMTDNLGSMSIALFFFGISYINLSYVGCFLFSKAETAFKMNILVMGVYCGGLFALQKYM